MSRERAHQCLLQYSVQMAHYRSGHCCPLAFPLHILHLQRKAKGWKSVFAELFQGVGGWEGAATFLQVALATSQLLHVYLISLVLPGKRLTSTSVFYRASVVFSLPVGMPLFFFFTLFLFALQAIVYYFTPFESLVSLTVLTPSMPIISAISHLRGFS